MSEKGLPKGWIEAPLDQLVARVVVGYVGPTTRHIDPNGIPFLTGKDIKNGTVSTTRADCVSLRFHESQPKSTIRPNDIVIVRIGRSGEAAVVPDSIKEANCGGLVIAKGPTLCLPQYLATFLNSPAGQSQAGDNIRGVTRRTLNTSSVAATVIPTPPLPEQKRIVKKIEDLQSRSKRARVALEKVPDLIEKFRQSVLAAAFRGDLTKEWRGKNKENIEPASELLKRIRIERRKKWEEEQLKKFEAAGKTPKDDKWKEKYKEPEAVDTDGLPELPEGWCWASLGAITWSVKDGPHHSPKYVSDGVPFISGGNVRPEGVDFANVKFISAELHKEYSSRCCPEIGDILYTKGGTTGIARVNTYSIPFNVWVHVAVLKVLSSFEPFFIQHLLNSPFCYAQAQSFTHGVGNQDLGLTRMVNIVLPIMGLEEQKSIIAKIDQMMMRISTMQTSLHAGFSQLLSLDQSILAKAFRGELVPQDPNDEPASVLLERIRKEREAAEVSKSKGKTKGRGVKHEATEQPLELKVEKKEKKKSKEAELGL